MRRFAFFFILISSVASAQTPNSKLGDVDGAATPGTSVTVSARNNKNIVAYAGGRLMYSNDTGATWNQAALDLSSGLKGTPVVTTDSKGNFFVLYSKNNEIVCHHSTDNGKTWSEPIVVAPSPGKEQYAVGVGAHPKKEALIVTWTESDKFGSDADDCKSNVMMSTSGNGGKKWSKAIQVNANSGDCKDEDMTMRGSRPIIGADDKAFIVWSGNNAMFYDRSYDGSMWISTDLAITEQHGGWAIDMPGFGKIANTPSATIDNSSSRIHGTLFIAFSDLKSGEHDSDIWLVRSVNRGDSWTAPARVNQDKPGREQFLPRISIDPATAMVYVLYYDRRDSTDNQTNVYLSWSTDGGNQFKEKKINDKPFVADFDGKDALTEYISISSAKGIVIPVWTSFIGGKQEVWTTVIKQEDLK